MQSLNVPPLQGLQSRVLILFLGLSAGYAGLACRFIYLQAIPHGKSPATRDLRTVAIPARRGDILDRNGVPLAISIEGFDVSVRPNLIRKLSSGSKVAASLSSALNVPESRVQNILDEPKPFAFVQRHVSRGTGLKIRQENLPGVQADPAYIRAYPQGQLAAQVLGRVDLDQHGVAGLEKGLDRILRGQDGLEQYRFDGKGRLIPGSEEILKPVVNGADVRLTLDTRIQQIAEEQLDRSVQDHHAAAGCAVELDVKTGEILAIANRPTFDPSARVLDPESLRDRAISYPYEPGSTMKMVTAAAALQEGAWNASNTVTCSGSMMIGRRRIRCVIEPPYHGGHGVEHLRDIIRNSCNVGAATVGLKLGGTKLFEYIHKFNLLERPRIGLPGAVAYPISKPETWARVRLANIAFGQGIMVTPLQLLSAYASIGNGGVLMRSQLVSAVVDPQTPGFQTFRPAPIRAVVTPEIARRVTNLLRAVVYDGTGKSAQLPGYSVAGKTGSAQKAGGHGYLAGKYIASFVGFAPASQPRVACLTLIDEPRGIHWGAVCAAPVVREILRWSLQYLGVPPDAPDLTGDGASMRSVREQEARYGSGAALTDVLQAAASAAPGLHIVPSPHGSTEASLTRGRLRTSGEGYQDSQSVSRVGRGRHEAHTV